MDEADILKRETDRENTIENTSGVLATTWQERTGTGLGKPSLTLRSVAKQEENPSIRKRKGGKLAGWRMES